MTEALRKIELLSPAKNLETAIAAEPLTLIDEQNNRFGLFFRYEDCGMDIYLDKR